MSKYRYETTPQFDKSIKKISKNFKLQKRLIKKIEDILTNPYHYKPLKKFLKNRRRTHIGSFVLIFEIDEKNNSIIFRKFEHHDKAYK